MICFSSQATDKSRQYFLFINFVRRDESLFLSDIVVTTNMEASREIFNEDIIYHTRYSLEHYSSIHPGVDTESNKRGTVKKYQLESYIRVFVYWVSATWKPVLNIGAESVPVAIIFVHD